MIGIPRAATGLSRPIRIAAGLSSFGISDRRLAPAVAGRVILVTGASTGIGRATALRLARNGAVVLALARRAGLLDELREEAAAAGGEIHPYPTDLNDLDACAAVVERILDEHGHVDVIVNNAGKSIRRWLSDSVDRFDNFEQTANVNYLGPVRLIMALLPSMRARRSGHIVNVNTAGVHVPPIGWTAYIASKSALAAWMRGAAPELRAFGITSTNIHMQLVFTPMLGPFWYYRYAGPIGNTPEEAASAVCRAIVDKPMSVRPWPERLIAPVSLALDNSRVFEHFESLLVTLANRSARPLPLQGPLGRLERIGHFIDGCVGSAGLIAQINPFSIFPVTRLPQTAAALRGGLGLATILATLAARFPNRPAMIDDDGPITAKALAEQVDRVAAAMRARWGIGRGDRVGILCANHRGFAVATFAAARLSADIVPLNYGFAGPQIGQVLDRENVKLLCYDAEFHAALQNSGYGGYRMIVREDGSTSTADLPTITGLAAESGKPVRMPAYGGSIVILTGGTTGVPKGAPRRLGLDELVPMVKSLHPRMLAAVADLERMRPAPPLGEPMVVPVPLHHAYGFGSMILGIAVGSPIIVHRKFDPEQLLADIERYSAGIANLVPAIVKRVMDLPDDVRRDYNTDSLRWVPCGGAAMPPWLAVEFMDEFGDVLFNGYGSTETGLGTFATPEDLRAAPGTVGRPPKGLVDIQIVDDAGRQLPVGFSGRIVNKNPTTFRGYSGGGNKEIVNGYMDSGDVGHFDSAGRLFIDGRSDDMIVSGGENAFPQEVEETLLRYPGVADAGAIGVPDADFGQRLAAFVVVLPGASCTETELKTFLKANLANYKVPRDIHFVDALPRTTVGKLCRQQLTELLSATSAADAAH